MAPPLTEPRAVLTRAPRGSPQASEYLTLLRCVAVFLFHVLNGLGRARIGYSLLVRLGRRPYIPRVPITDLVKFVYCHRCKELRVKPWYSIRARCARCRRDSREIVVPRTTLTYVAYALVLLVFATVFTYSRTHNYIFLYGGVAGLIACFVVQAIEISRGEKIARSRIKATKSDAASFKDKGWL